MGYPFSNAQNTVKDTGHEKHTWELDDLMIPEFQDHIMPTKHRRGYHCPSHYHQVFIEYLLCVKHYALALSMH